MAQFQNLTGTLEENNAALKAELQAAQIQSIDSIVSLTSIQSGLQASVTGLLGPWAFRREGTHWIAEGPGMPMDVANILHTTMGHEIRVGGATGGADPETHFLGFAVSVYHIDTQDALDIFADALRGVIERSKLPRT